MVTGHASRASNPSLYKALKYEHAT
jgi:hypothetical protein